jgi:hypothetical protein
MKEMPNQFNPKGKSVIRNLKSEIPPGRRWTGQSGKSIGLGI